LTVFVTRRGRGVKNVVGTLVWRGRGGRGVGGGAKILKDLDIGVEWS